MSTFLYFYYRISCTQIRCAIIVKIIFSREWEPRNLLWKLLFSFHIACMYLCVVQFWQDVFCETDYFCTDKSFEIEKGKINTVHSFKRKKHIIIQFLIISFNFLLFIWNCHLLKTLNGYNVGKISPFLIHLPDLYKGCLSLSFYKSLYFMFLHCNTVLLWRTKGPL